METRSVKETGTIVFVVSGTQHHVLKYAFLRDRSCITLFHSYVDYEHPFLRSYRPVLKTLIEVIHLVDTINDPQKHQEKVTKQQGKSTLCCLFYQPTFSSSANIQFGHTKPLRRFVKTHNLYLHIMSTGRLLNLQQQISDDLLN